MTCDACKRIPTLTGSPCRYCGRLNVEAELATRQLRGLADRDVARDAAQFRRGVEAAVAIVERNYFAAESLTDLRNLRGDDDG